MKTKLMYLSTIVLAAVMLYGTEGCKKDSNPTALTLTTLTAGSVDMNGAVAANTVPTNITIVAGFTANIDAATATSSNITLTRDYDNVVVPFTVTVATNTINIVPTEVLASGALYKLAFGAGIKSTDAQPLAAVNRNFTTIGTFAPSGLIAYWNFEDNATDQVGTFTPTAGGIKDMSFTASRNAAAGKAATFNGTTSLIEIPNGDQLMNTTNFTLCFWVKTNSTDKTSGHFVMGLGGWNGFQFEIFGAYDGCKLAAQYDLGNGSSASEDLYFNGAATGTTKDNGGWQGWTFAKDLTASGGLEFLIKDKWAHIVCVFNGTTKVGTMYINGEKMKSQDFNLWPTGDAKQGAIGLKYAGGALGNQLAFGFIQGSTNRTITDTWADPTNADPTLNHLKGQLDDVRIYHKVLTAAEIDLMYKSEKP